MKIGIDGRAFLGNKTGVGKYMVELCQVLDTRMENCEFYLYANKDFDFPELKQNRWYKVIETNILTKFKTTLWFKFFSFFTFRKDDLDMYIASTSFFPLGIASKTRTISVIYDMNYLLVPETMSWHNKMLHAIFYKSDLKKADNIISISHGTAERLKRYYGRESDAVFHPMVADRFYPYTDEQITPVRQKYNLDKRYILSVSTMEPRKNIAMLIEAFAELVDEGHMEGTELVLAGRKGWKEGRIFELVERYSDKIKFLGYVPDEDLPMVYAGASLFVFPSIYEGFGIPVREAILCATPVIASDIPEIREAGGSSPMYIAPEKEALKRALLNPPQERPFPDFEPMQGQIQRLVDLFRIKK